MLKRFSTTSKPRTSSLRIVGWISAPILVFGTSAYIATKDPNLTALWNEYVPAGPTILDWTRDLETTLSKISITDLSQSSVQVIASVSKTTNETIASVSKSTSDAQEWVNKTGSSLSESVNGSIQAAKDGYSFVENTLTSISKKAENSFENVKSIVTGTPSPVKEDTPVIVKEDKAMVKPKTVVAVKETPVVVKEEKPKAVVVEKTDKPVEAVKVDKPIEAKPPALVKEDKPKESVIVKGEESKASVVIKKDKPKETVAIKDDKPKEIVTIKEEKPTEALPIKDDKPKETAAIKEEKPKEAVAIKEEKPKEAVAIKEDKPKEALAVKEEKPKESLTVKDDNKHKEDKLVKEVRLNEDQVKILQTHIGSLEKQIHDHREEIMNQLSVMEGQHQLIVGQKEALESQDKVIAEQLEHIKTLDGFVEKAEILEKELVHQAASLEQEYSRKIKTRLDQERQGRLAKLDTLAYKLQLLQKLTLENNESLCRLKKLTDQEATLRSLRTRLSHTLPSPFWKEIKSLKESDDLLIQTVLSPFQEDIVSSFATKSQLIRDFDIMLPRVRQVQLMPVDGGPIAYFLSTIFSYLLIPKTGKVPGKDIESILSRASEFVHEGDLDSATREMNSLRGWPKALARDWLTKARNHLTLMQALDALESHVHIQLLGFQYKL